MESSDHTLEALTDATSGEASPHEEDLPYAGRYLSLILENSGDLIFACDTDGAVVMFSRSGERTVGYSLEQVKGRSIKELAVDPLEFERLADLARKEGSAVSGEFPFQHRDGHAAYFHLTLVSVTGDDGRFAGILGLCRDMAPWKRFQEDLIRVDRLAEIGRTASGIAHEINNPVAVIGEISGWIEAVVGDAEGISREDREELETAVQHIVKQVKRCRGITQQLLSYVRDSGPARASLDLHELLRETVKFLDPELKHRDIEVVYAFVEGPLMLQSDRQMLEQVFVNLISNAIYAVKEKAGAGGRIEIKTLRDGSMLEIRVADNGTGISEKHQERMYDLFFTTKPAGKGTGLGLPICRNIIRKLGGDFSFETEVGKGTSFVVRLPVS